MKEEPSTGGRGRVRLSIAAVAAALALSVTACGTGSGGKAEAHGIGLAAPGKLTICTHLPYKPFEFQDGSEVVGFDADLLGLLAKSLDVQPSFQNIEWSQIVSGAAFAAQKCDVGMGAMSITPERRKVLGISDPYMNASQVLLVKKGSPYKGLADLKGKKVAAQADTAGKKFADEQAKKYGFTVVSFDDVALQTNNVRSGRVDAAINDNGVLLNFAKEHPDTAVTADFSTGEKYGFATKRKDPNAAKLLRRLNSVLAQAKSDGDYTKIYKKWFGTEPKK